MLHSHPPPSSAPRDPPSPCLALLGLAFSSLGPHRSVRLAHAKGSGAESTAPELLWLQTTYSSLLFKVHSSSSFFIGPRLARRRRCRQGHERWDFHPCSRHSISKHSTRKSHFWGLPEINSVGRSILAFFRIRNFPASQQHCPIRFNFMLIPAARNC